MFMAGAKAQFVKWGNSQAVRIPKSILNRSLRDGEESNRVEHEYIWLEAVRHRPTLEALVRKVTGENRHGEQIGATDGWRGMVDRHSSR